MTIRWKDGKVDRPANAAALFANPADIGPHVDELADALDECVAALTLIYQVYGQDSAVAYDALRKIGVES